MRRCSLSPLYFATAAGSTAVAFQKDFGEDGTPRRRFLQNGATTNIANSACNLAQQLTITMPSDDVAATSLDLDFTNNSTLLTSVDVNGLTECAQGFRLNDEEELTFDSAEALWYRIDESVDGGVEVAICYDSNQVMTEAQDEPLSDVFVFRELSSSADEEACGDSTLVAMAKKPQTSTPSACSGSPGVSAVFSSEPNTVYYVMVLRYNHQGNVDVSRTLLATKADYLDPNTRCERATNIDTLPFSGTSTFVTNVTGGGLVQVARQCPDESIAGRIEICDDAPTTNHVGDPLGLWYVIEGTGEELQASIVIQETSVAASSLVVYQGSCAAPLRMDCVGELVYAPKLLEFPDQWYGVRWNATQGTRYYILILSGEFATSNGVIWRVDTVQSITSYTSGSTKVFGTTAALVFSFIGMIAAGILFGGH